MIAALAAAALNYGPSLIRGIGSVLGLGDTAEKVASAVETVDKIAGSADDKKAALTDQLAKLDPAQLVELQQIQVKLDQEQTRRQQLQLADRQANQEQTQQTIRNGDNADDAEIRHTRPRLARKSFWAMVLYIVAMSGLKAFGYGDGPDITMAGTIGSFAMAYMGLRTLDGFAKYPKSDGGKTTSVLKSAVSGLMNRGTHG